MLEMNRPKSRPLSAPAVWGKMASYAVASDEQSHPKRNHWSAVSDSVRLKWLWFGPGEGRRTTQEKLAIFSSRRPRRIVSLLNGRGLLMDGTYYVVTRSRKISDGRKPRLLERLNRFSTSVH
ncbi:unnamed protein product, partial [Nesidiocoris tenuis]